MIPTNLFIKPHVATLSRINASIISRIAIAVVGLQQAVPSQHYFSRVAPNSTQCPALME